eukprot:TRINITY_DN47129_c0_g2_i1.p1 TRINITY_DN47129_c0_g2~~TRINITY_DN47129_c0_g2_i1.p1  ORF type:complete len:527 (+),score=129.67 TRINITY_DN47129_c0_g2_i1:119-1699(+)
MAAASRSPASPLMSAAANDRTCSEDLRAEGDAGSGGQLLSWDMSFRRLFPMRLQHPGVAERACSSTSPPPRHFAGGVAAATDVRRRSDPSHERLIRSELWSQFGRPMHFVTLEFDDEQLEEEFQQDSTRRQKRWVSQAVLAAFLWNIAHTAVRLFNRDVKYKACVTAAVVFALQYAQLHLDRGFVLRNFQEVLLLYSVLHATSDLYWASQTKTLIDEEVIAQLVVIILVVQRMRFYYFVLFAIYICIGFETAVDHVDMPRQLLLTCVGGSFLSHSIEVLHRKDFVQACSAWKESARSDLLLDNILPGPIIKQLKVSQGAIAQSYEQATVLFADVVSFTTMSAQITPVSLVNLLNRMFRRFDQLAEINDVEKIKTIGDCYMAAAGLPLENPAHAQTMARFGLQMLAVVASGELRSPATDEAIRVRVGIHSGPCVAGVIGQNKFAYDVWGDAVNTASRMESTGEAMRLHCSADTHDILQEDFVCEAREPMQVKGKGLMQTYFVVAERLAASQKSFVRTTTTDESSSFS